MGFTAHQHKKAISRRSASKRDLRGLVCFFSDKRANGKEHVLKIHNLSAVDNGPVVQSIISLTSSLRGRLVKCFTTL